MVWKLRPINGSIPINVARAYGITPARPAAPPSAPLKTAPVAPAQRGGDVRETNANIGQLVAGRVEGSVEFTSGRDTTGRAGAPTGAPEAVAARAPGEPYQLYTRAADRIEAAVGIQLGRSIDVKG